jgi:2-hydroxychromene-2-carboxylate isomerase
MFENYEYRSELFQRMVAQGKAEGRAEGFAEAVLEVLRGRHIPVDESDKARLATVTDHAALLGMLRRALTATSFDEVLAG